jgi:hypothetical protein
MAIDWNQIGVNALGAMKGVFADKWGEVASLAQFHAAQIVSLGQYLDANKNTLSPDVYQHLLQEKADYITANLGGLEGITSVMAREAANAAIDVLTKALTAAASAAL